MQMITLLEHNVAFWRDDTYMVLTTKPLDGFKCQWHPCRPYRAGIRRKKVLGSTPPNPIGSTPAVPRPRFMNTEPATRDHEWESTRLGSFEPCLCTYTSLMRVGGTKWERNIAYGKQRQELRAFSQTAKLQAVTKQSTAKGLLIGVYWYAVAELSVGTQL